MRWSLPERLYRGDRDKFGLRNLGRSLTAGLQANLGDGGDPDALRQKGLALAAAEHSGNWYQKNGFLSFSSRRSVAEDFLEISQEDWQVPNDSRFTAALWVLDLGRLQEVESQTDGVYRCSYKRELIAPPGAPDLATILLVDVVSFSQSAPDRGFRYAKDECEWLVLPTGPGPDGRGLTSKLDSGILDYGQMVLLKERD